MKTAKNGLKDNGKFMYYLDYKKENVIRKNINKFIKKYKNKSIIVYGAGKLSSYIFENYDLSGLNIIAVADRKFEEFSDKFFNIQGIAPNEIKNFNADCIIIFNLEPKEIINYLDEHAGLKNIRIECVTKYHSSFCPVIKFFRSKPKHNKNKKYVFTFWEPKNSIPLYLQLCMRSWQKYLKDYEIVVLNYNNLDEWLGSGFYDEYLYENFSLPKQADAIRAAILYIYGGIWLDMDIIITSDKIYDVINKKSDVVMFGVHIGFIVAKRKAKVLKQWIKNIKQNIFIHKLYNCNNFLMRHFLKAEYIRRLNNWNYLGNLIIDKIRKHTTENEFLSLKREDYFALPENNYYRESAMLPKERYIEFFFNNDYSEYVFENEKGVIYLHNSWTPDEYKNQPNLINCTLTGILKKYCNADDLVYDIMNLTEFENFKGD